MTTKSEIKKNYERLNKDILGLPHKRLIDLLIKRELIESNIIHFIEKAKVKIKETKSKILKKKLEIGKYEIKLNEKLIKNIEKEILEDDVISITEAFVKKEIPKTRPKKHYLNHVKYVRKYAFELGKEYKANLFVLDMAALLHDVGAYVGTFHAKESYMIAKDWLRDLDVDKKQTKMILDAILNHQAKHEGKKYKATVPKETKIIRDADSLSFLYDTYDYYSKKQIKLYGKKQGKEISIAKIDRMLAKTKTSKGKKLAKKFHTKAKKEISKL